MRLFLSIFFVFSVLVGFSQNYADEDVPAEVLSKFKRKFPKADNVSWDKVEDNYKVDCFVKGRGTYAEFTPEGEWVLTVTDLDLKKLYPPVQKYIDDNFRKDKLVLAEMSVTSDKQDFYYVQLAHKAKNIEELQIIELFFDKTGRIEEVILPDDFQQVMVVGIDDRNADVPAAVIDSWQKKFPNSTDIEWTKDSEPTDTNEYYFIAHFEFKEQITTAEFGPNGRWMKTTTEIDHRDLILPIANYLSDNFEKEKVLLAEKTVGASQDDFYYVQIAHKGEDRKAPYIFELVFDNNGIIKEAYLPDGYENFEIAGLENKKNETPSEVIKSWKKRFPRSTGVLWSKKINTSDTIDFNFIGTFEYRERPTIAEFLPNGKWYETRAEYKERELYAPVLKYINENHWGDEMVLAEKVTRADRKGYYYVKLERMDKGQFRPYVFHLYFSKAGIIQKVERPEELKNQYLLTVDIPKQVGRKFKSRFPRAKEVKWETDQGNWVASFTDNELPTTAIFTDSAQWVQTKAEMDVKNIYSPLQRNLDKLYSGYKVVYGEKVTRKDRKNYYYVELVARKKSVSPRRQELYFDKMGRLKED